MKYPLMMRLIHWTLGVIIIGLIITGLTHDSWPKDIQPQFYYWHKSFGIVALALIFIRIFFRIKFKDQIPPLPKTISKQDEKMAKAGHHFLYLLMLVLPISGYIMSMAGGHGIKMFGIEIPNIFSKEDKELGGMAHEVHEVGGIIIAIVVSIHILAVIKHKVFDKENLLKRMA